MIVFHSKNMLIACLETLTIGLPFCGFKFVGGHAFGQKWLIGLAFVDLIINGVNFLGLLVFKRRVFDACFLSFLVRLIKKPDAAIRSKWQDLGNSLDVMTAFTIVAVMIGGGFIKDLSSQFLIIWNLSVILNVVGAGSSRLSNSIKNLSSASSANVRK